MSLEEKMIRIKDIAMMAKAGKTDEYISNKVGLGITHIATIRCAMGIYKRPFGDITEQWRKASVSGRTVSIGFGIADHIAEKLGFDRDDIVGGKNLYYIGKIVDKKLVLTFGHKKE